MECGESWYCWQTRLRRRCLWLATFSKSRAARSGQRRHCQPVPEPHQIERDCRADVLQVSLCLPDIARSPQVTAPHSLRERPFDAVARRVSLFESRFRFLAPRLLQGAEFSFQLNCQQAALAFRLRALRALRARIAVARCEEATSSRRCGDDAPSAASGYDRGSGSDETRPPTQRYGVFPSDIRCICEIKSRTRLPLTPWFCVAGRPAKAR
jgi:hypothetical protein